MGRGESHHVRDSRRAVPEQLSGSGRRETLPLCPQHLPTHGCDWDGHSALTRPMLFSWLNEGTYSFFLSILDIVFNNCKDWSTEVCLLCFACVYVNPYTRQHLACMPNFFPKERLVTKSCIRSYILKNKKGFMWPGSHYPSWTMKSRTETVTTGVEAEWWLKKKIQRGGRAGILNLGPTGLLHKGSVHRTQEIHQTWIGENDIFISTNL